MSFRKKVKKIDSIYNAKSANKTKRFGNWTKDELSTVLRLVSCNLLDTGSENNGKNVVANKNFEIFQHISLANNFKHVKIVCKLLYIWHKRASDAKKLHITQYRRPWPD